MVGEHSTKRRRLLAVLMVAGMALAMLSISTPRAWAGHHVILRVVIEHVEEDGCTDTLSGSDFYSRITIAGQGFDFGTIDGEDEISPNWTAEKALPIEEVSSASVVIQLADYDTFLNFGDDTCDIDPGGGLDLDVTVTIDPCSVTGDASGGCGVSINTSGNGGGDGSADLRFRVEVIVPPPVPGLAVRCTHSPLWPQPGDDVTITVEALDGSVWVGDTMVDLWAGPPGPPLVDHKKIADQMDIWVTDETAPDLNVTNSSSSSFVVNDVPAGDLVYKCDVTDGPDNRSTGWRRTRVGPPVAGTAIPVIYTGARTDRIDIVFVADEESYSAANDPAFLADAADVIKGAYYGQDYHLANQQRMNFWLANQVGDADGVVADPTPSDPSNQKCVLIEPQNWFTDYSWADAGAILHTDDFRDCANNGLFSTEPTALATALHEAGHQPFGLADEYCCDGGYFENPPFPNMFDTLAECQADAPTLGRTPADCRTFTDSHPMPADWFLSEPTPNDLMSDDSRPPQAADIRRMDWVFSQCDAGNC